MFISIILLVVNIIYTNWLVNNIYVDKNNK